MSVARKLQVGDRGVIGGWWGWGSNGGGGGGGGSVC